MQAFGLDTSHWDGFMDWQKAALKGVSFGIFKMSDFYSNPKYPSGWIDKRAGDSWAGLLDADLISGAFCWLQPKQDPGLQAELYLEGYTKYPTDMPPILDFEDQNVNSWNDMLWRCETWLEIVEHETGEVPILYTSPGYIRNFDRRKSYLLRKYPLWLAAYTWLQLPPKTPYPWDNWLIWQYSDKEEGTQYGAESRTVDTNYFNGTVAEMRRYFTEGVMPAKQYGCWLSRLKAHFEAR